MNLVYIYGLIAGGRYLGLYMDVYDGLKVQPLASKMCVSFLLHQKIAFSMDWHSKIQTLFESFKIHSLLPLVILDRTWPESQKHDHCSSASLHCFHKSLILCASSYVTEDASLGWMKTSMWKTILLPSFVPKISQVSKDPTVPLKNERGSAVLWNYPQ